LRPFGVVVVVVLFFVFSAVDVVALFVDGDIWWIVSLALSGLLVFLFRKLWWGDAREREIAVCFGFFLAAIIFLGMPEGPPQSWPLREYANLAEGCYFLCAASYLAYSKRNPFFGNLSA